MASKIDNLVYRGQGVTVSKTPYHGTINQKETPLKKEAKHKAVTATKKRAAVTQNPNRAKNEIL